MVEEIGEAEESLRDVVKHVGHVFVDASPVVLVVHPLAILGDGW